SRLSSSPCLRSMARMAMSTALPAALVATILPLRSSTFWIGLSLSTKNWLLWWPSVPSLIADDAQILQPRILDRERERRKGEVAELDLVVRQRRDDRRRALEAHRLENVTLAVVLHQLGLLRKERRPVGRRHDPTGTDLDRLGAVRRCARKEHGQGQRPPQCAHVFPRRLSSRLCARGYHRREGAATAAPRALNPKFAHTVRQMRS